jgi:hypothetical protein
VSLVVLIITKLKKQSNKQTDKEKYAFLEGWEAKKKPRKKSKSGAFALICPFCREWVPVRPRYVKETDLNMLIFRRKCSSCKTQLKFEKHSLAFNRHGWIPLHTPGSDYVL